jgi:hypothetical protein
VEITRNPLAAGVQRLSDTEAANVAGIVDGEGTVTLTRTHRGENRRPVVSISNTDRLLLEYIHEIVGAGKITNKARARSNHTPSFAYSISSRSALALLAQITPYLRTYKSQRALRLLRGYASVTPRNGRYSLELQAARASFEARFFQVSRRAAQSSLI